MPRLTVSHTFQKGALLTLDGRKEQGDLFLSACHNSIMSISFSRRDSVDWVRLFFCTLFLDKHLNKDSLARAITGFNRDFTRIYRHYRAFDLYETVKNLLFFSIRKDLYQIIHNQSEPTVTDPQPYEELGEVLIHAARLYLMLDRQKDAGVIARCARKLPEKSLS